MQVKIVFWLIYGFVFVLLGILSIPFPRLIITKKLESEFVDRPKSRKHFLIHARINICLLGVPLMLYGILPETLALRICMSILACVFISVLVCNKCHLGRWTAKGWLME